MSNVEDRRGIITRLSILQYVITGLFSILAISFWVLQVAQHAKFEEMAENNHQRTLALRAPRGIVLDRDGRVLVENRPSFSISIMREHSKDLNRTIRMLAAVLGYEESAFARSSTGIAASRRTGRSRSCWTRRSRKCPPSGRAAWSCRTCSSSQCRRGDIRTSSPRTRSATSAR